MEWEVVRNEMWNGTNEIVKGTLIMNKMARLKAIVVCSQSLATSRKTAFARNGL